MGQPDLDTFSRMPEWLITILILSAMTLACEVGYRLGRRSNVADTTKALVPFVASSILAIVALLLGFTMSMSVSRYDARRLLVLQEANAINTAYLRTQALPAPESTELQELLRRYAEVRLSVSQAALDLQKLRTGRQEAARLQNQMWSCAATLAQNEPQSLPAALLLEALNNAFDLENARWISFVAHVPESVIYVNAFMGLVAALLVGYDYGLTGHRHPLSEALLIVSITVLLAVIIDLDQPHRGVVRVSQKPLIDLQQRLATPK